MEVYIVMDESYLDLKNYSDLDFEDSSIPLTVNWLGDSVALYDSLASLMADYGIQVSEDGFTERQIIKELYYDHNLIVVKNPIYSMEDVLGSCISSKGTEGTEIIQML